MPAVLTIHPTLAYPFFSLIRPLFLRALTKGGWICEGLLYYSNIATAEKDNSVREYIKADPHNSVAKHLNAELSWEYS